MLDWNDFRILLGVARAGSLSAAARQLGVDQSTTSRRLAALEAAAGARLFDRTPRGYTLTEAGEAVLKNVEEIEARATAVERQLAGHDTRLEGVVRVAASDSFAAWFLLPRLPRFKQAFPGITLSLVTGNRAVNLALREADISVRLSKPSEPNLIARRLGVAAWALYGSRSYLAGRAAPRLKSQLAGHDVLGFDPELRGTVGARWLVEHAARAHVAFTTNSLLTQATAVTAGLGLSPLPCLFGDPEPGLERALPRTLGHHDIWLVVHPDVRSSPRVRVVIDYLSQLISSEKALLAGQLSARRRRRPASPLAAPSRAAR